MRRARWLIAATCAAVMARGAAAQQRPAPAVLLERAEQAMDSAHVERADSMLRALLPGLGAADGRVRARALQLLAARHWWSDERDTAQVLLRASVAADPFMLADTLRWHPELTAAYQAARRARPALAIRAVADTVIRPDSGSLAFTVAVGRPGQVRARLQRGALDSVVATIQADSIAVLRLSLRTSEERAIEPGSYNLIVETSGVSALTTTATIEITRMSVDTSMHESPPGLLDFRPESRRGRISMPSVLRGLALAAAAAGLPIALANADVGSDAVKSGAMVAGASIGVMSLIGASAGRAMTTIDSNVTYNRDLRESWRAREARVTAANDRTRRFAPLRVRVGIAP